MRRSLGLAALCRSLRLGGLYRLVPSLADVCAVVRISALQALQVCLEIGRPLPVLPLRGGTVPRRYALARGGDSKPHTVELELFDPLDVGFASHVATGDRCFRIDE